MFNKLALFVGTIVLTEIACDVAVACYKGTKKLVLRRKANKRPRKVRGTKAYKMKNGQTIVYADYTVS